MIPSKRFVRNQNTPSPLMARLSGVLFLLAWLILLYGLARIFCRDADTPGWQFDRSSAAAGSLLYLLGHVFRTARLVVLVGNFKVGLKRVAMVHFFTAGFSALLPFKLGELYRIAELQRVIGDWPKAVVSVWIERTFDIAALCALLALVWLSGPWSNALGVLLVISLVFVVTTISVFGILPFNLKNLALYIVRRYRSKSSVAVLQGISLFLSLTDSAVTMLQQKKLLLALITGVIWACELGAFMAMFRGIHSISTDAAHMLTYISDAAVSTDLRSLLLQRADAWLPAAAYARELLGSLLIAAAIAGLCYMPTRLRAAFGGWAPNRMAKIK